MPLPITHGNGGGIQPEDTSRQNLLGTQVRTPGSNVASFAQTVEKDPEFNAGVAMDGGKATKYQESRAPTAESIHAIDYSRRLELFETA